MSICAPAASQIQQSLFIPLRKGEKKHQALCLCVVMEKGNFWSFWLGLDIILQIVQWSYYHLSSLCTLYWIREYWLLGYLKDLNPNSPLPNVACPKGIQQSAGKVAWPCVWGAFFVGLFFYLYTCSCLNIFFIKLSIIMF